MQEALFSKQWYRVASLRPRIRPNVVSHRHHYRGAVWYIVGTKSSKSNLRLNAAAFHLFSLFDGERSVEEIWQSALTTLNDDAPAQDEMLQLLSTLFDAALIDVQWQSDVDRLFENHERKQRAESRARYWNPLFLRFALFDPNRLAQALLPWCAWAFSRRAFHAWLLLTSIAVILAAYSWSDLSRELTRDLVSPANLMILWLVFPLMKLAHELAHAVAVKCWGGEVHELGVALLVLLPVPYVDASDSARFDSKHSRMAVAGAGIIAETALACAGLFVWLAVEPGLIREIAFNVLLTGSVSSLLFNGNPLLKFDSYYVVSDLLEIPNLASRSSAYLLYLIKRYIFRITTDKSPVTAPGERRWFICYGIAATAYRLVLTVGVCLFVASEYFFIGVGLAIWALAVQVGRPVLRGLMFLFGDARLGEHRLRVQVTTAAIVAAFAALLFYLPMPNTTQVRGVVWPVEEALVRAGTDCLVQEALVESGVWVEVGTELIRCDVALLEAEVLRQRASQVAARAALFATRDRFERGIQQTELDTATDLLAAAEAKLARATLSAAAPGVFFAPDGTNLSGRFFEQGAVVGYVLNPENVAIRTMLDQERVALLDDRLDDVHVRMVRAPSASSPSTIRRRVPAATDTLVTRTLGTAGGGELALHPEDRDGLRLEEPAFELELELPEAFSRSLVGEAVEIQFDHGRDSVAALLYRELRLLLLRRLDV